jgi:hypothetical protein
VKNLKKAQFYQLFLSFELFVFGAQKSEQVENGKEFSLCGEKLLWKVKKK